MIDLETHNLIKEDATELSETIVSIQERMGQLPGRVACSIQLGATIHLISGVREVLGNSLFVSAVRTSN